MYVCMYICDALLMSYINITLIMIYVKTLFLIEQVYI